MGASGRPRTALTVSRSWSHAAYDVAVSTLVHAVLSPIERVRILRRRSTAAELDERMGRWEPPTRAPRRSVPDGFRILVHAVSVGEVAAAGALITAFGEIAPETSFVLSTGNREGRTAAESLRGICPAIEAATFMPWDRGRAVRQWLRRMAPDAVVVIETEIWPNLFGAAAELGIPLFIANGRIYPADVTRYQRARWFFAKVMATVSWIGAQSAQARDAFISIGAPADRVEVAGELKADAPAQSGTIPEGWRSALEVNRAPLVIAGSTHDPEELMLLDVLCALRRSIPDLRLVLAPRHPGRSARLRRKAQALSFSTALWSAGPRDDWDVLLIDRVGPLAELFRWAEVAVVGGSLVPRGGHNPLEAAALGRSILIGPSYEHFQDLVDGMRKTGGIRVLPSSGDPAEELGQSLLELLADPDQRVAMGRSALEFIRSRRGVADRYVRAIMSRIGHPNGQR